MCPAAPAGVTARAEDLQYERIAREEARERRRRRRDDRRSWQLGLFTTGRVFLGCVFAGSAAGIVAEWSSTLASLQDALFDARPLLPVAVGFQLLAGLALAVGFRARFFALAAMLYLAAELLVATPNLELDLGRAVGLAHLGLASALAMVAAHGAGPVSVDRVLRRRRAQRARRPARFIA